MQNRTAAMAENPVLMWAMVNALNAMDALLTYVAISRGLAREANPVVTSIGLDGKVLAVALISAVVALVRPKALWVPSVALGAIVAYTVLGLAVTA